MNFTRLHPSAVDAPVPVAQIHPPRVSIIVSLLNESTFIGGTLDQLLAQDYPTERFEILVIDGGSADGSAAIVRRLAQQHPCVHLLHNPQRLSSATRNIGLRHAQGDIVVMVDGHCQIPGPRMLRHVAHAFAVSGADCVGRPQPLNVGGAIPLQRAIAAARASRLGHHPHSCIYSCHEGFVPAHSVAVAYRRSLFDQVGDFDETFDACEDVELNHRIDRAGLRCYLAPAAAVHYHPRATLGGLFRQLLRYGRGRVRLLRKHPDTFSIKTFLPALFVLGCVLGLGAAWISPRFAAAYTGALAVYGVVVLGTAVGLAVSHHDAALLPWLPPVFVVIHVAAGVGLIAECLHRRRPTHDRRPPR